MIRRPLLGAFLIPLALPAAAENPHDGYVFWMPSGELKIGDAASEKTFGYTATASNATFTVRPRSTRMGVAAGQFVIIRPGAAKDACPEFTVDGKPAGTLGRVTFIPLDMSKDKNELKIEVKAVPQVHGNRQQVHR